MSSINDSGERKDLAPAARRNLRREQIRAAALELEQGECDSTGKNDNIAAEASGSSRIRAGLGSHAPSGSLLSVPMPQFSSSSSSSAATGSKRSTPPGDDVPPSPMVTPPTASQSAPPPQQRSSGTTPNKPSPPSGRKGGVASPGGSGGGVPHVYHDYGHVPDEPGYVRKKTGGVTQPFPEKLYEMLESEGSLRGDVVEWLPHGRAFIVRRPKDFTDRIMPKYFRQSKLTSFQRQLNLYGFRRLTQGPDGGAYYHEMFLRGRPALCCRMKRQKVKGTGHKQPADANTEPNFYTFPPVSSTADVGEPFVPENYEGHTVRDEGAASAAAQTVPPQPTPPAATALAMSPGIASIHGAAHLLRRIASDERNAPFVGLPPSASIEAPSTPLALAATSTALWGSGQGSLEASSPRGAYFLRQGVVPNNKDRGPGSSTNHGFRC